MAQGFDLITGHSPSQRKTIEDCLNFTDVFRFGKNLNWCSFCDDIFQEKMALPSIASDRFVVDSENGSDIGINRTVMDYVLNDDAEGLAECFDDASHPSHESVPTPIAQRCHEDGRCPLDWAALLGHVDVITELVKRGVEVNGATEKG